MFKNFGKVFRFTFRNMSGTKSYLTFTIIMTLILFILPPAIMVLATVLGDKDKELESCMADTIYVADDLEFEPENFRTLKATAPEGYKDIKYVMCDSVDDALSKVTEGEASFVLHITKEETFARADIIIPEGSVVPKSMAENYFEYIREDGQNMVLLISGLNQPTIMALTPGVVYKTFTQSGYESGVSVEENKEANQTIVRDKVMEVLGMLLPYLTIMLLYFMVISYGNSVSQLMIMEKESKLMDTMLISLHPEAMVFGKLLATICSSILQIFLWIGAVIGGFAAGIGIMKQFFPSEDNTMLIFLGFIKELGLFEPVNIVLAVIFIAFSFSLYISLAAVGGSMASNREEAGSMNTLFVMPLLVSFLVVLNLGGLNAGEIAKPIMYIPFTAALIMPAKLCLGAVQLSDAIISLVIMIATTLAIVIAAGRVYKMMSLYKGNKPKVTDVFKILFSKS
ncbi:MAG: ABC transporter permease [Lachnospiraceae bacterium]|nr:ABC transporter permease [Lachnospiraceae bacterium]